MLILKTHMKPLSKEQDTQNHGIMGKRVGKNLEEGENKEIFRQSQEYQLTLPTYAQRIGIDHSSQQFDYCCRLGRVALCLAA